MSTLEGYKKIMTDLRAGTFKPVYLLHGEEVLLHRSDQHGGGAHSLWRTTNAISTRPYSTAAMRTRIMVKDTCLRYPMMAERQLVVVRELQNWRIDAVEKLESYFVKPTPTTVLVLCYKHKKVDGRKSILKSVTKGGGQVFLSDKVREDKLPDLLISFAKNQKRRLGRSGSQFARQLLGQ